MKRKPNAPAILRTPPLRVPAHQAEGVTPRTEWTVVTPELANKWLEETNSKNRTVRQAYVERLAADMREGRWQGRNGEAIRFDKDGRLVDGQHRLYASVKANTPFESLVVYDVEPEAYSTIGIGSKKSLGDFLGPVAGEKNTALLAAALRLATMWLDGNLARTKEGKYHPTYARMEETLAENPAIRESVNWVTAHRETRRVLTGTFACLIHFAAIKTEKRAQGENFLSRLGDGLGLMEDDPVYQLRRFLLSQKGPTPGQRRAGQQYVLALAIKAWNAYRNEEKLKLLKFSVNEEFPRL